MSLKLVVIGGGSSYTPEIIEGIINRAASLPISEITLVDIEEGLDKLTIIGRLSRRMIEKSALNIKLEWTTDRRSALQDADFVSTQIRVGGLNARKLDERIPLKYGYIGQETNGAGGIFKAFRTIPVLMDIASDIHEICPDAWMINFTNPAGIVTEALLKHGKHKKVIGVCNIPYNMKESVSEVLNVPADTVTIEFTGLNHYVFGTKVEVNGTDRLDEVLDALKEGTGDYSPANIVNLGWSRQFLDAFHALPNPYHQYYFQTKEVLKKDTDAYQENGTRAEQVMALESSLFKLYQDEDLNVKPAELEERGGAYYSDVACSLMNSLHNDTGDIQTVNVQNDGTLPFLADDAVIETNCVITKNGAVPLERSVVPASISGLIYSMKHFETLVIDSAVSGCYDTAYLAMMNNPLVQNEKDAKDILDELLNAHKVHLPQFN
ncbi:6-phospho-beta-glucosidase [Corticicoccus populi]|uniref:6-phospho-beta-glucosidase n=1 Tax=Corticicoccus populi TaxID=1812821 RepID=A0ABW5WYG4_9STAP